MSTRSRRLILLTLLAALAIEAITCLLRFGLNLQSTSDTSAVARFTFGLRIHHSYLGGILVFAALFWQRGQVRDGFIVIGSALVLSDLAHHFLVLWPTTGSPQFDLFYR